MYYIIYGFLKLLSFLPLPVLYLLSDFVYFMLVYVFKYRKAVVLGNLKIAFPEKTDNERIKIMKDFYHNFCDTFIEMIKMLSWSKEEILKRFKGNPELMNQWKGKEQSIQLITGHYFNWEMANLGFSAVFNIPFVVVYMPVKNKPVNEVIKKLRSKNGTVLIPATDFKNQLREILKKQYILVLVGDQNPGIPKKAYWTNFFTKPAPFVKGPEKGAKQNNTILVYTDFYKIKRGYYQFDLELVTTNPGEFKEGELTKILVKKVEESIRKRPANYLWSHRRWKHEWKEEYRNLWIG
ncbi:MAG: lipid A biosynthesis acyltransferase [Lacibacter sp.]